MKRSTSTVPDTVTVVAGQARYEGTESEDPAAGVVTPEAVRLDFAIAGLGSRTLAFAIDLGIRVAMAYVMLTVTGIVGMVSISSVVIMAYALGFLVIFGYPVAAETFLRGRTLGKMAVGLRVVTTEGAPVRFRHAAIRAGLGVIDFVTFFGSIAVLSALVTRRSQRLGDLAAGTIVVREKQALAYTDAINFTPPAGWEQFAAGLDVGPLTERQYVVVRSYLLRFNQLTVNAQRVRGQELVAHVVAQIGTPDPYPDMPQAYLASVCAAYQRRGRGRAAVDPRPAPPFGAPRFPPPPVWVGESLSPTWGTGTSHA